VKADRPARWTPAAGAVLALLASAAPARAVQFRVDSSLEPRVVGLGEPLRFTIEAEGPGFEPPRLRPRFELDNLKIVGGPDQRHSISMGTGFGDTGWSYSWTWWLAPKEVGTAAVREVFLLVGDQRVELPPRSVRVVVEAPPATPGAVGRPPGPPRSALEELLARSRERLRDDQDDRPEVFLRAVASPAHPYVGQRVVYTLYLYTRVGVRAVELESLPTYQGLWARPVELEASDGEQVEWEGTLYTRLPLFSKELFAFAPSSHRLEPVRARFVIERIESDRMFASPLRVPVQLEVASNALDLDVRPLPPPAEAGIADFSGAVGQLALVAELTPRTVAVGQGATLELTVAGDGHLEALLAPALELPAGVELIGPQPVASSEGDGAARSWRYLLVPRRPGSFPLPAVELAYFDPDAAEYRVARAAVPDLVAHSASAADSAGPGPPRPIRSAALPAPPNPLWRTALPWAFALPWVAALVLVLVRRRPSGRLGSGGFGGLPAFRERLRAALSEERPRRAAAGIERAWRGLLSEALGVPVGMPAASWPDKLLERGLPRDDCRTLRGLLDDLHYLRFAPELSAITALAGELVSRSEHLARDLLAVRR
jgi:hypothetical protein